MSNPIKFLAHARRVFVCAALVAVLLALSVLIRAGAVAQAAPAEPIMNQLLQFTSGGHVIGFAPTQVYLAALDHALRIEFAGAAGVTPVAARADANSTRQAQPLGQSKPLGVVTYRELWRGIDVEYRAAAGSIAKSTYTVAPGANPMQIRLRYNVPVTLQSDGSLQYAFGRGYVSESAPIAWQEIDGKRVPVQVAFRVLNRESPIANRESPIANRDERYAIRERITSDSTRYANPEVGFRLGAYNPRYTLTIDPNYQWHTFYGSSSSDTGIGIAVDGSGNVYVTGDSPATWQGDGSANPLHAHSGSNDIAVVKLTTTGAYQWHTFYGSTNTDYGNAIAAEGSSSVYVTGRNDATWQGDNSTNPLHAHTGGVNSDIAVLKLSTVPTAVNVTGLQARVNPTGSVVLKWQTTSETNIAGFDVYRQTGKRAWKKINAAFLEAQHPGDAVGASYRFMDKRVKAGKTYRYKIQVWYLDGHSEWTESVRVKMK